MKSLFVGNISYQTSEDSLRSAFERYGEVKRVKVVTDRDTGRPRGFAFIEMAQDDDAARAIGEMNGTRLDGRTLSVNEARPRAERSPAAEQPRDRARELSRFTGGRPPRW